jgi:DNA polymerase III subunit epsilon
MQTNSFTSIDFETATGYLHSACAVGIVSVNFGIITNEYYRLIQPPDNLYWWQNISVHGIKPENTANEPTFYEIFPEIHLMLNNRLIVAHNESFDRNVLKKTMEYYGLRYHTLEISEKWECTVKIYREKGFKPANLNACCSKMNISLNHHNALSDAKACAELYLRRFE